jgi:hypothetical protein
MTTIAMPAIPDPSKTPAGTARAAPSKKAGHIPDALMQGAGHGRVNAQQGRQRREVRLAARATSASAAAARAR